MIDFVIFDFDGTLVESESLAAQIESEMLGELGLAITPEEVSKTFSGVTPDRMAGLLKANFDLTVPDTFFPEVEERFFAMAPDHLKTTPNAEDVLKNLDLPFCVASNSTSKWINHGLSATGLDGYFKDQVYAAEMVTAGKPSPEIFHMIADRHGLSTTRCLVIDDSTSGIKAALAAGSPALGYTGGGHCLADHGDRLAAQGAPSIIDDLMDILTYLESAAL